MDAISVFHMYHGTRERGQGKTIEQQLAEYGLQEVCCDEDGFAFVVWDNYLHDTRPVWVTAADIAGSRVK